MTIVGENLSSCSCHPYLHELISRRKDNVLPMRPLQSPLFLEGVSDDSCQIVDPQDPSSWYPLDVIALNYKYQ